MTTLPRVGPRVGVFHPGSQNSWQRATAFQQADALGWYATSVHFHPDSASVRLADCLPQPLAARAKRELLRRHFPLLDPGKVRRFGLIEFAEIAARRLHWERTAHHLNMAGNRRFGAQVIRLIEREPVDVVWGYNNSSVEVFRWAKAQGLTCVLDQSIGHPAAMNAALEDEAARHPEYFRAPYRPFDARWIVQQDEEMALADLVVCGSDFCAHTMIAQGCDPAKLRVVPYGYDETLFPATPPEHSAPEGRPLDLLFVGQVGPRKGVPHLLKALDRLPERVARLTLVGRLDIPEAVFARHAERVRHIPQLPRREVVSHFRAADAFVFPSLFEGSAVVLNEALGAGLGVIQSQAAGDGAYEGRTGTILPDVSAEALAETIATLYRNPERLAAWRESAWAERGSRSWEGYRARLGTLLAGDSALKAPS